MTRRPDHDAFVRERARGAARWAYELGRLRAATLRAGVGTSVLVVAEHHVLGLASAGHAALFFAIFVFLDWRGWIAAALSRLRRGMRVRRVR